MGATVLLRDVIGKAQHRLMVGIGPFQGCLDDNRHAEFAILGAVDRNRRLMERGLGAVEISGEGLEPAGIAKLDLMRLHRAVVGQDDAHAGIQEGEFAQAVLDGGEIIVGLGEGGTRRQEGDLGPLLAIDRPDPNQRRHRVAMGEADVPFRVVAPDAQFERFRQRVDDRNTHAVQAARHLIGILVELTAGMELGHDDLGRRDLLFLMDIDRDAAAVVGNGNGIVGVERDGHQVCIPAQSLVDRVIDDLIDHMVQARPVVGIADIHSRPLAHGVEATQNLDGIGVIFAVFRALAGFIDHKILSMDPCRAIRNRRSRKARP